MPSTEEAPAPNGIKKSDPAEGKQASLELLREAIANLPKDRLVVVVESMCRKSSEAKKIAEEYLVVTPEQVPQNTNPTTENPKAEPVVAESKFALSFADCKNCNENYDTTKNYIESCAFHPGMHPMFLPIESILMSVGHKVVDDEPRDDGESWWDQFDWEDWRDGQCEDHIDDEDYAEGFKWTCCGQLGDGACCVVQMHEPDDEHKYEAPSKHLESELEEISRKRKRSLSP